MMLLFAETVEGFGFWGQFQFVLTVILQVLWMTIYELLTSPSELMLNSLRSVFPVLSDELSIIQGWLRTADYFVDIDICLTATGAYIQFLTVWTGYKHAKSWIPTVSST